MRSDDDGGCDGEKEFKDIQRLDPIANFWSSLFIHRKTCFRRWSGDSKYHELSSIRSPKRNEKEKPTSPPSQHSFWSDCEPPVPPDHIIILVYWSGGMCSHVSILWYVSLHFHLVDENLSPFKHPCFFSHTWWDDHFIEKKNHPITSTWFPRLHFQNWRLRNSNPLLEQASDLSSSPQRLAPSLSSRFSYSRWSLRCDRDPSCEFWIRLA